MKRRLPAFLLLLTVWLHTVLSVPWHHAQHVAELWPGESTIAAPLEGQPPSAALAFGTTDAPPEDHPDSGGHHTLCAWCTVLAHATLGPLALPVLPVLALPSTRPTQALPIGPGRQAWRLAWARAPPTRT